jgi:sulfur-oxidizing protein SoxA
MTQPAARMGRAKTDIILIGLAVFVASALSADPAAAQTRNAIAPGDSRNPLSELISGHEFSPMKVRALQDDDFDNPGFKWVSRGEALWSKPEGTAAKSCASCHGEREDAMRGRAAEYPKFSEAAGKVINLAQRINICRSDKMNAEPWAYDSQEMLSMTAFLDLQSRGLPRTIRIDGPAQSAFEKGRQIFDSRMGQLGLSCALCHDKYYGKTYGDRVINQGHSNGYPSYQLGEKSLLSLHERFTSCFRRMKAEPYPSGSEEYVALELYLAWRGAELPLEAPAVRR